MSIAEGEVVNLNQKVVDLSTNLDRILGSLKGVEAWIPSVDAGMQGLRRSVEGIKARVIKLEAQSSTATPPPNGHRVDNKYQGEATAAESAQERTLVKSKIQIPQSAVNFEVGESSEWGIGNSQFGTQGPRLPKTEFPKFDGDNPKLWKKKSEKYFDMYQVPYATWASFATLHFVGNAALWLQTYEELHAVESWSELCVAVNGKFGRDRYQQFLEKLDNLKQEGTIEEYYSRFEELMHKVLVYNRGYDETFFVTKFLGGLKTEIKAAIKLHRPGTVDAALSLAKTQEELLMEVNLKAYHKTTIKESFKNNFKVPSLAKGILGPPPDEIKKTEERPKWEEQYDSLNAARRARGECFKCGEKFGPGHKCPKAVQLHVLDELLEVFQFSDEPGQVEESSSDEELLLSENALFGTEGKRTIWLQGLIQQVLILIDSGSSSSFMASHLVDRLHLVPNSIPSALVMIIDGGKLFCDEMAEQVEWWCQGNTFSSNFKILGLGGYDLILGMDWLEAHSPMWIHWGRKTVRFTHSGKDITLQGVQDCLKQCSLISRKQL